MTTFTLPTTEYWRRPEDEKFWNLPALIQAFTYEDAEEVEGPPSRVISCSHDGQADDRSLAVTIGSHRARPTYYSFGQLCNHAGIGRATTVFRQLPARLSAPVLNWGLQRYNEDVKVFRVNGSMRAITSPMYQRVYHADWARVLERTREEYGLVHPPAWAIHNTPGTRLATDEDCKISTLVKPGDRIGPAGVYGGVDSGCYAFMASPDKVVESPTGEKLHLGIAAGNGENGDKGLWKAGFAYQFSCGNLNLIGLRCFRVERRRHVGRNLLRNYDQELRTMVEELGGTIPAAQRIVDIAALLKMDGTARAKQLEEAGRGVLWSIIEDLTATASRANLGTLTRDRIEAAVKADAEAKEAGLSPYGDSLTMWSIYSRLTEQTRAIGYTDQRVQQDSESAKLLEILVESRASAAA